MKEKKKVEEEITEKELREQLKKWHEKRREDERIKCALRR